MIDSYNIISKKSSARVGIFILFGLIAILLGFVGAVLGWFSQVLLLSIVLPATLLLFDYRIGMIVLIVLMPFSGAQFIPKAGPFSLINVLLLGLCAAFIMRVVLSRMVGRRIEVPVPRWLLWFYVLPVTAGFMIGTFHLNEIPSHIVQFYDGNIGGLGQYWVSLYFKSMLIVFSICILASAIIEYGDGKRFVIAAVFSGVLFSIAGFVAFRLSGSSLEVAVYGRLMFSLLGLHANSVSGMLLPVLAVSLFIRHTDTLRWRRVALSLASAILIAGILLTGSRGGVLGLIAVVVSYIFVSRNLGALLFIVGVTVVSTLFMPDALSNRLLMGTSSAIADGAAHQSKDALTSGRLWIYSQLLPEVLNSPFIGRGITSIHWSEFVKHGNILGQPHNLFLTLLLDLGLIGFLLIMFFYMHVFRSFKDLSNDIRLDPMLRSYFSGSIAGLLGYLIWGMSIGNAYPSIEQWFLWLSIGMAIGYRRWLSLDVAGNMPGGLKYAVHPAVLHVSSPRKKIHVPSFWRQ